MSDKPMTQDELDTIRTIMGQTTPGNWYAYEDKAGDGFGIKSFDGGKKVVPIRHHSNQWNYGSEGIPRKEDAIFLAMSKEIVRCLMAEVERLNKVSHYLAERLSPLNVTRKKYIGATLEDGYGNGLFSTREEAIQSWLDEANREVNNAE